MKRYAKAAILKAFGQPLTIEERPVPEPGPGEVLVEVKASGLCVSDIHIQDGIIGTVQLPYTPGHEMAGVVAAVGFGVNRVKVGDHITAAIDLVCGSCKYCLSGRTNLCRSLKRIGFERDGSHQEYCVIPQENAFPVADHIPFAQVTGLPDAVGCMYHAIKDRAQLKPGERILIMGTGGLGMNAIQIARLFGAEVYATSRREEKLNVARSMGAVGINTARENLYGQVSRLTSGELCDVVIDNIGIRGSVNDALKLVGAGGKVIVCGYQDPLFEADYQDVMKFEKEIIGLRGMTRLNLAEAIRLVEEEKIIPFVDRTIPFEDINRGYEMLRAGQSRGRIVMLMGEHAGSQN